jgi:hypothetical protein
MASTMADVVYVLATLVFFVVAGGYVVVCRRLQ